MENLNNTIMLRDWLVELINNILTRAFLEKNSSILIMLDKFLDDRNITSDYLYKLIDIEIKRMSKHQYPDNYSEEKSFKEIMREIMAIIDNKLFPLD